MGNETKSTVFSGAVALADGLTHVGVSVGVRAGDKPAAVVIPDCNPLSGVTTVYVNQQIELPLESLATFLSAHGLKNGTVIERLLKGSSLRCDAFYYTHRNPKEPKILHPSEHNPGVTKEMLDTATAAWEAANPAPLLMQFAVDFDVHEDQAKRDIALAKAYKKKLKNADATIDPLLQAATTKLSNRATPEDREAACVAAATALATAKDLASKANPKVELDGESDKEADQEGGLIKSLTGSSALSQLFEVTDVTVRVFRCGEASLPKLKEYATELLGTPPVTPAKEIQAGDKAVTAEKK